MKQPVSRAMKQRMLPSQIELIRLELENRADSHRKPGFGGRTHEMLWNGASVEQFRMKLARFSVNEKMAHARSVGRKVARACFFIGLRRGDVLVETEIYLNNKIRMHGVDEELLPYIRKVVREKLVRFQARGWGG